MLYVPTICPTFCATFFSGDSGILPLFYPPTAILSLAMGLESRSNMTWKSKLSSLFSSTEEPSAAERLGRLTLVGPGVTLPDRDEMLSVIEEVERASETNLTEPLANALGYAIECYTAWHVRGDDRKAFLQRACDYYRRAGNNAALAKLLVEEAQVRNLEEAIPLLETIYKDSKEYDPVLCSYSGCVVQRRTVHPSLRGGRAYS
jgi:hypothetical protein